MLKILFVPVELMTFTLPRRSTAQHWNDLALLGMMIFLSEIAYSSVKMANSVGIHSRKAYKSVQTETGNEDGKSKKE